jgi:hypothetical protein
VKISFKNRRRKAFSVYMSRVELLTVCRELIYSTTQQEIIDAVNLLIRNPWLSYKVNYTG